jgi:threonine aldolase
MWFGSDNAAGAHRDILEAVRRANEGYAPAYGGDELTQRVETRFCEIFEREVRVFFAATGGAANGLALSQLCPPWGMILAHEASHIQMDECGGPEFLTGGAKILPVPGAGGKLDPVGVRAALDAFPERAPHGAPARVLSLTEASESGTLYRPSELEALCNLAHERGLSVHVDGARFANALAALGASPADLSWRAGVDALSFGATKNGCLAAEAVVFFDPAKAADFAFRRKRAGQLLSKSRFIAAQFDAYFANGLWLKLAAHANLMAQRLGAAVAAVPGATLRYPVEANAVFASFPPRIETRLREAGAKFYQWTTPADPPSARVLRLVCSFATTADDVDRFASIAREG